MAQVSPQQPTRLTTANGLPHNAITGMEQDRAGFIWIATHDGLARYDGLAVKIFRNRPGDSTSLINNKISQLDQIANGAFLITTESGSFQRFDPVTEKFSTLLDEQFLARNNISISQGQLSADGRHLWGIQPNIQLVDYDLNRKTFKIYEISKLVGDSYLHDFILTAKGYIYGDCTKGLLQFDTKTGRSRIIPLPFKTPTRQEEAGFWPINGHKIVEGPDGQIALFGIQVVGLYDPIRNQLRTIPIPDVMQTSTTNNRKLATVVSYALKTMNDKQLYLGYMDRVYRLDRHNQFSLLHPPGPPLSKVAPWLLDQSGVLWMSGASAGLNRLDLHALPFAFLPKHKSFSEDLLEQNLGVSLPDRFEVWDNDRWPRYMLDSDRTGYLIDPSRVYRHDPLRHSLSELTALFNTLGRTCCKLCLKVSRQGRIWLYNNGLGLIEGDREGKTSRLLPRSLLPFQGTKPAGYPAADIQPMGQVVWVGSQLGLGLFRYDTLQKRFDKRLVNDRKSAHSLSNNTVNCLSADPIDSTVLWVGTVGGGLCRLATRTMRFRRFEEANGFPSNIIQSIETDDRGFLWCATNRGLVRLNPRTMTWRHFTTDDGLAENTFLQTSSAHLVDGRLVFGTANGRVIFNPAAYRDTGYEPPLVLTSLLINSKPVDVNQPDSPLTAPLNTLSEVVLDHTQNFLTIGFAGLDYGKTARLVYRYKLTGVDANWVMSGGQTTANYTQLAPGRYVFSVNSTNADGRWCRQIKQLAFVIRPPFWATWWAYSLYALAFGGLVLGFIRLRIRQGQQRQEVELKRREAEQLRAVDEVKTRFFSNITHEFRTPLTLILSPTEKLLKTTHYDAVTRQTLQSIHQSAGQLLGLINQLLDLSKLEGSTMTVSLVRGDGIAFIQHLIETLRPMATSRNIRLHCETSTPTDERFEGTWLFDADKWAKILTNLLSNALKFTPPGEQVSLLIDQPDPEKLVMQVTDTGIGISSAHLPHVFDRFYQADDSRTRAYEGTGIGLALVKELTTLLGGTIAVQSRTEAPTGTTFTLTLPVLPVTTQPDASELVLPDSQPVETTLVLVDTDNKPAVSDDAPLVLVVDDNDELRSFMAGELGDRYRVITAADGVEGWTICQRELPDVVLSDVMMPRLDGYQLAHFIKSTLATNHLAVVLLTAKAAHESRIEGLTQGADDYLTKPFHLDELRLRLNNLLTRQENLRAFMHRQLLAPAESSGESVDNPFIGQLHRVIEARLDDATLGVDDLAEAVGMSRRTLHRKLTATTNLSALEFIRYYRLQRATQLLRAGRSVAETAYTVGFESHAYFSKLFKQTYHQTPSEFLNG